MERKIRAKLLDNWYKFRSSNIEGKLCTYLKVKDHFGFENYLTCINNFKSRKALCGFRISAHTLQIEKGRFSKIPREERICKNCSLNKIEDEEHFLCQCPKFDDMRHELFEFYKYKISEFEQSQQ